MTVRKSWCCRTKSTERDSCIPKSAGKLYVQFGLGLMIVEIDMVSEHQGNLGRSHYSEGPHMS